jgi:riboflavin kinase/FMN adenylyltransferase
MTFEPHPIQVLAPDKAPKRISTPSQKIRMIAESGIDVMFVIRFNRDFASLSPNAFVRQYLVNGLHTRALCVGSNFSFGHRQDGKVETLRQWAREFELIEIPPVLVRDLPASSTQVRKTIMDGDVSLASRFLGRWFGIEGRIVRGAGRGRVATVPTLNMEPYNELLPQRGVYATRISLDEAGYLDAVTNIGVRPTFGDAAPLTVETFVLRDPVPAEGTVRSARLQFLHRIRAEMRFDSPELLAGQIQRDVRTASKFFRLLGNIAHARAHSH